jgi:hypothetical protein
MSVIELSKKLVAGAVPAGSLDKTPDPEPSVEPRRLKLLIVDDCPGDARLTEAVLRHVSLFEPTITSVSTLAAARFALGADAFDALIINDTVGGQSSLPLVSEADSRISCVVVAPAVTARLKIEAHGNGAVAVFPKGALSPKRLQSAIVDRGVRPVKRGKHAVQSGVEPAQAGT